MRKLLGFVLFVGTLWAQTDSVTQSALDHFYNLEYEKSVTEFRAIAAGSPNDAAAWNHVGQVLFFQALYQNGMMGSDLIKDNDAIMHSKKLVIEKDRDEEICRDIEKAKALSHERLSADASDAKGLYDLGNALALRANYAFLVKHAWMEGLKDANQSRKLHEQLARQQPDNYDARLIPGTHEYMVGTLPFVVRMCAHAAGLSGNKNKGLQMISEVALHGNLGRADAEILLPILYRRENRTADGIAGMRRLTETYPRNFLFRIELAKFDAEAGDKREAAAELDRIEELIHKQAPGFTGERVPVIRSQETVLWTSLGVDRPVEAERTTVTGALSFTQ